MEEQITLKLYTNGESYIFKPTNYDGYLLLNYDDRLRNIFYKFIEGEVDSEFTKLKNDKQKALAEQILGAVSQCLWVEDEKMIDAVTALSGSGPAYFFLMIESMAKAGVALGLDEKTAEQLSIQTALGASMMASNGEDSAHELRAKVTSPNGTTQAAIESFQDQNFEMIVSHAMRAAFDRARKMGTELGDDD